MAKLKESEFKAKGGKRKLPRTIVKDEGSQEIYLPPVISSEEPVCKKTRWLNRQRVLVFCSRGSPFRVRHLMIDMRDMLAHSRSETKMDKKDKIIQINEMCRMRNCNKCLYFESKRDETYLWISDVKNGPSAKFHVQNVHTMGELKLTGNCLKTSRPLLSFDKTFDAKPHWRLLRELFIQIFGVPSQHPRSQPFVDHVFSFSIIDDRIWFRNYQILQENAALTEIGPRFVLHLIRIFDGSFGGETLYSNPNFVKPRIYKALLRKQLAGKYQNRVEYRIGQRERRAEVSYKIDPTDDVFLTPAGGQAARIGDASTGQLPMPKKRKRVKKKKTS